jgi:purine-binding chemotaxis protein CheW
MSKIVRGTINIRGEDALVISLRGHFGMEELEAQLYTPLLLTKIHGHLLALIVDAVMDVMSLPLEKVTGLQHILPEGIENIPMLKGIAHSSEETILVLEPERLFYNRNGIAQPPVDLKTSADDEVPVQPALEVPAAENG